MKIQYRLLVLIVTLSTLVSSKISAQTNPSVPHNPGIWEAFATVTNKAYTPEIRGRLSNVNWKTLEPAPNVWVWDSLDLELRDRAKDSLPIIYMVYTKQDAPDWIYDVGVPKVVERDIYGAISSFSPYYVDPTYKGLYKRMVDSVANHVKNLPDTVRKWVIGVQGCMGSTGDAISYKGTVDAQYYLSTGDFQTLFQEFSLYFYNAYSGTNPKISVLLNPPYINQYQIDWINQNCYGSWLKQGTKGKAYQLNDEADEYTYLFPSLNLPQPDGSYLKARSELGNEIMLTGWWLKCPYKNMYSILTYCAHWGIDWSNQPALNLLNPKFDSAFGFFNRYAGQKDPTTSVYAMCALKDGLDAADLVRFPASIYGNAVRTDTNRYKNIAAAFAAYGAKLEDPSAATLSDFGNLSAKGLNDVGWRIFPGNYERYIHQLNANTTSAGYWNVASTDSLTNYGRFARGFDLANGKDALYFDVDNDFLRGAALDGQYPVSIDIIYLDNGTGSWKLFYDAQGATDEEALTVTCTNTNKWKKASITLQDAYFGNRGISGTDFYIKNNGTQNVKFALVELARPANNNINVGLAALGTVAFDTICASSSSQVRSFQLSGAFLDGSPVTIKPLSGFTYSTSATGTFSDSLVFSDYGATLSLPIYVKFTPAAGVSYSGNITLSGGGVASYNKAVTAVALSSSPSVSPTITNVNCNNAKNGSINLNVSGGIQPITYSWTNDADNRKFTTANITELAPANYTVVISSPAGCIKTLTYPITQPDVLTTVVNTDSAMVCRFGTTTITVSATGGTLPYSGTGTFTVASGTNPYTVTDANGCSNTKSYTVTNGTLTAPAKPGAISAPDADAKGVCGGGTFTFSVDPVATATSYTWTTYRGATVTSVSNGGATANIYIPSGVVNDSLFVTANNVCGSSNMLVKYIAAIPVKPASIAGPTGILPSAVGLQYSTPATSGLTYTWTVPAGASITSGQNTPAITANWGVNNGNVAVKASNTCGTSYPTQLMGTNDTGVFTTSVNTLPVFDTVCVNGLSAYRSFTLSASGLDGSGVVVGPLNGFKFSSSANGTYTDSIILNYTSNLNATVYVKFNPADAGSFNGLIPVYGGGGSPITVGSAGISINSSPVVNANVTNVTCYNSKNGIIDVNLAGGSGPFTYLWAGNGINGITTQDVNLLNPGTYTVTVTSKASCKATTSFTVTEPDALATSLVSDNMICKNTTTSVYVTASGGTLPYSGIGTFTASAGSNSYTVTDANGCTSTKSINVANGTLQAPAKPGTIFGDAADAKGLCTGGTFAYSIDAVTDATSYTWTVPSGCSVLTQSADGASITMSAPVNFASGTLSVTASNVCGTGVAQTKSLNALPGTPASISGPIYALPSQSGLIYTVNAVPSLTYNWTVNNGATITAGQNTATMTAKWGTTDGKVTVKAVNACGMSTNSASLNVGVTTGVLTASVSTLPAFDTVCVNGLSAYKTFQFSGSGLSGAKITVGPVAGFKFATTANGTYTDTVNITGYGTSINQNVYVKFNPSSAASYSGSAQIQGGGGYPVSVAITGTSVNTSPALTANITNAGCFNSSNGVVDLVVTGGTGPFTYSWSGAPNINGATTQDITALTAKTYTVTVGSKYACSVTGTFTVSQPDQLVTNLAADNMLCKNGTTNLYVTATGGTTPYSGVGTFTVSSGSNSFTVTDAHGCTASKTMNVANGALTAPAKPGIITGADADLKGVCGGGVFTFSVAAVTNATSYTWAPPRNGSIASVSADGLTATINIPSGVITDSVTVKANGACGISAASSKILPTAPGKPAAIFGLTSVLPSEVGLVYSVTGTPGLTYTWTVPAGSVITAGQNTSRITVTFGTKAGNVTAKAVNSCGSSQSTVLAITLINKVFNTSLPAIPAFDTVCLNTLGSKTDTFKVTATGLTGVNVVAGPAAGFQFSLSSTTGYSDSAVISGYGTLVNQNIYVRAKPSVSGIYTKQIPVKGGGAPTVYVSATGYGVQSSPSVPYTITAPSCNGGSNGAIDITPTGGTGPFTYSWTGTGVNGFTTQDVSGIKAGTYSVVVNSYAGCSVTTSINVTQPNALVPDATADNMVCKNGTTIAHVSATGGTLPYTGTGNFTVSSGNNSFTVTDAKGCTATKTINVANGTGVAPAKPGTITGTDADLKGICGGTFAFSIASVATATSYTWTLPSGFSIVSGNNTTGITASAPASFTSGSVTITANNSCGTSVAQTKSLTSTPAVPTGLTGPTTVTAQQNNLVYSVTGVSGLNYSWIVPASAIINSGQGTPSLNIKWGNANGTVKVSAYNACATSGTASLTVTVAAPAPAPVTSTSNGPAANAAAATAEMKVAPNPAKDKAYFTFRAAKAYSYTITITSLNGKTMEQKKDMANIGMNSMMIDVHNYSNGLYIISLITETGEIQTVKLVKQ